MSKIVSVEFGVSCLRVAALSRMRKAWGLSTFVERAIPVVEDNEGFPEGPLVEALNTIFDEEKLPRDQVALCLPAHRCTFRYFAVDFTSEDAIRKTIKYQAEEHLPTTSIENVIVNHYRVATEKDRTHLLVSIVEKKLIRSALKILESSRIDPVTIDIDLLAALNTYKRFNLLREPSKIMLVELGERASNISLVIDGQLQFLRSPKLGVASMDGKAQLDLSEDPLENLDLSGDLGDLQLDISDLEKNLVISISSLADSNAQSEETGSSGSGQAQQQLEDRQRERFIGRLVKDLRRTVLTARKGAPEAIYLTGPGSQLPRVAEVLEEKFDVPVSTPEFLDHLPHQLGGSDPLRCNACLPSALGACFKLLGVDEGGAELRKEEFKFARKFEQIESVLMTGVSLLFVIALVLAFQFQNQARLAKGDYSDVLHEARQLRANRWWAKDPGWYNGTGKAPPEFLRSPVENQIVRLEDSLEDLKKLYDPNPTDEQSDIRPGLDVWFDVFEGLKQFVRDYPDQLILASFKIKGDDIFLQGKVANQSVESKLWDVVEGIAAKHSYMQRALQTTPPKPGKDGKLRINYRIVLKGARE